MSVKLQLEIALDSKGAVVGVKDLDKSMGGLDRSSKGADKAGRGLAASVFLGTVAYQAAAKAVRFFTGFVKESIAASAEQERVERSLAAALEITGRPVDSLSQHFKTYASELQKSTIYGDEAIIKAQTLLVQLTNLDKDGLDRATKGTIGLASVMGMDLNAAANLVSKAMSGQASALGRYGIQVDATKSKEEQRAQVMAKLEEFYGRATAETETYSGKLAQLKNAYGDMQEAAGKALLEGIAPLIDKFKDPATMQGIQDFATALIEGLINIVKGGVKVVEVIGDIGTAIQAVSPIFREVVDGWNKILILFTDQLGKTYDKLGESITRGADNSQRSIDKFHEMAVVAGLTRTEIRELQHQFMQYDDVGVRHQKMLQKLIETHPELRDQLQALSKQVAENTTGNNAFDTGIKEVSKSTKELIKVEKTLTEIMEERWAAANKSFEMDKAYAAFVESKLGPAIESYSDALIENFDITNMMNEATSEFDKTIKDMADEALKPAQVETKKWTLDWKDANAVMEFTKSIMGEVRNALSALGIDLGETGESLMQAAEGAATFVQGLLSGNPLTMIAGGFKIVGAAIKLFAGDGVGEAIKRENQWMKLTKEQIKQLKELEKQYKSTHAATSDMLDQLIRDGDVTADNFDQWAERLRGILSDYDQGTMTLGQTTKQMGDAFTSLIGKAKELGTEGSASLLAMFDDLEARGIRVAEVEAYIAEQLGAGLAGYEKMKAAMLESTAAQEAFGNISIPIFDEMISYQNKIAANKGLTDAIAGATQALIGLSNTTKLSEGEFDQFEQSATSAFDKLIAQGFTSKEALKQLAPMLARLKFLHDEYGLTLDQTTQDLLDQADAQGVNTEQAMSQEEALGRITVAVERMADVFGKMSGAVNDTASAFDGLANSAGRVKYPDSYSGGYSGGDGAGGWEAAASGWHGWVAGGSNKRFVTGEDEAEYVSITPKSQMQSWAAPKSGGDTVSNNNKTVYLNIEIKGPGVTPEAVADAARTAYNNNTHGFRSMLKN